MRFVATLFLGLMLIAGDALGRETGTGWLGATLQDLTKEEADALGWDEPRGAKIDTPIPGGPAEAAGLMPGDILLLYDAVEIENSTSVLEALAKKAAGTEIKLLIRRALREKRVVLTLGALPPQSAADAVGENSHHPILDAGGHIARITDLVFTPDNQQLVSASDDKTIRIWDIATGKTVRFIRGQVGAGIEGQIFTIDLSPDGHWLAAGGWFGKDSTSTTCCGDARLYDFATGKLVALLKGHDSRVLALAFSGDGRRLITGSRDRTAIIWDVKTQRPITQLKEHSREILAVGFNTDGTRAVTGSFDGKLKFWDAASGEQVSEMEWGEEAQPTLQDYKLRGYRAGTPVSGDGRWAARVRDEEIALANLVDTPNTKLLKAVGGQPGKVGFTPDGRAFAWIFQRSRSGFVSEVPVEYEVALPTQEALIGGPQITKDFSGSTGVILQRGPWSLRHAPGGEYQRGNAVLEIVNDGRVSARIERGPTQGYGHTSYSFTPAGDEIISGGETGVLSAYSLDGKVIGDFIGHESKISAIAPSPNGRYLVSSGTDRTVRLWNLKTRQLLVTLFQDGDGEWVMWTPQGYYAASGPGSEMIGWQINHGADKEAEYVNAAQLRKSLNRPDIVAKAIQLASAEQATKEAYGTNFKLADLLARPMPRFRIVSPSANASLNGGAAEVEIALDATRDPVKLIRVQVNGRQIAEHLPKQGGGFTPGALKFSVPLARGRNAIRLTALNETGETPAEVTVMNDGDGDLDKRGTLYILAIGVDKYPKIPGNNLRYSGADAKAFADAMERRAGPGHETVIKRVLVNGAAPDHVPTAANIINALGSLRRARETDTVMVFLAGHGESDGPSYSFLPTDTVRLAEGGFVPSSVVPWYAFQLAIESAKGRRILFLDTCHSGNSYNPRLSNDSYQANIIVYSAARWDQFSWERSDLGHGLFTYATVQGIEGKAAKGEDGGRITTLALRDFLAERVAELAKEMKVEQEPQYFRGRDAENYLLAETKQ